VTHRRSRVVPASLAAMALGAAGAVTLAAPTTQGIPPYDADACILTALAGTPTAPTGTPVVREVQAARPAWLSAPLTDACSGATFSLAQFAGKTVFVHPMATW
jgi:hypothetical protein